MLIGRTELELPKDADSFEEFVRNLFEKEYGFKLHILGKGPIPQDGVDIIGTIPDSSNWTDEFRKLSLNNTAIGKVLGIQAKSRSDSLEFGIIQEDHDNAKKSKLGIAAFVVITSANRNTKILNKIGTLDLLKAIYFNQDLQPLYLKYPDLWERYHPLGSVISSIPLLEEKLDFSFNMFVELGQKFLKSGKNIDAILAADSGIKIKPERIEPWIIKCAGFLSEGKSDDILTAVEQAEKSVGDIPQLIWFRAVALLQKGDDGFATEFTRAYELSKDPEEPIVIGYVSALVHTDDLLKAENLVNEHISKQPDDKYWNMQSIIPKVNKMRVELRGSELVQGVLADGLMVIVWSCGAIV